MPSGVVDEGYQLLHDFESVQDIFGEEVVFEFLRVFSV